MAKEKVYQCYYCGRFMDDLKAVRRIRDLPYRQPIRSCIVCDIMVNNLVRSTTLEGRQRSMQKILREPNGGAPVLGMDNVVRFRFVGRDGYEELKEMPSEYDLIL